MRSKLFSCKKIVDVKVAARTIKNVAKDNIGGGNNQRRAVVKLKEYHNQGKDFIARRLAKRIIDISSINGNNYPIRDKRLVKAANLLLDYAIFKEFLCRTWLLFLLLISTIYTLLTTNGDKLIPFIKNLFEHN